MLSISFLLYHYYSAQLKALKSIHHYNDVIMDTIASQITSLTIVYPTVYSGADQRKHQSSASLAFVCRIHRRPVNSPHKWPVTRKMFPFDDVIVYLYSVSWSSATKFWIEADANYHWVRSVWLQSILRYPAWWNIYAYIFLSHAAICSFYILLFISVIVSNKLDAPMMIISNFDRVIG